MIGKVRNIRVRLEMARKSGVNIGNIGVILEQRKEQWSENGVRENLRNLRKRLE